MPARYGIEFTRAARRELAGLPADVVVRIDMRLLALQDDPRPAGVKRLQGSRALLRLRIGDYR